MKRLNTYLNIISILGMAILFFLFFSKDKNKIGFIEINKLLDNYPEMKVAQEQYNKKVSVWEANLDSLMIEYDQELRRFQEQSSQLTEEEKETQTEVIKEKENSVNQYRSAMVQKAENEKINLESKVLDKIKIFFEDYGNEQNYSFIFSLSGTNIIYSGQEYNITQKVVDDLNKK